MNDSEKESAAREWCKRQRLTFIHLYEPESYEIEFGMPADEPDSFWCHGTNWLGKRTTDHRVFFDEGSMDYWRGLADAWSARTAKTPPG